MVKTLNNKLGFTVIELLVSLSIVAIISSLALPLFNQYSARAHFAKGELIVKDVYKVLEVVQSEVDSHGSEYFIGVIGHWPNSDSSPHTPFWFTFGSAPPDAMARAQYIASSLMPANGIVQRGVYFYTYFYINPRISSAAWHENRFYISYSKCNAGTLTGWSDGPTSAGSLQRYDMTSGYWANGFACS